MQTQGHRYRGEQKERDRWRIVKNINEKKEERQTLILPATGSSTSYFQTRFLTGDVCSPVTSAWNLRAAPGRTRDPDEERESKEDDIDNG